MSFSIIYYYDSSGNYLRKEYHGGTMLQVTDGMSTTVMIGERPPGPVGDIGWWSWYGLDVRVGAANWTWVSCPSPAYFGPSNDRDPCGVHHFWSWHTGGGNFAFGDGSVRFLSYTANQVLIPLSTRAGGEVVDASQY
jgi:prepilin-type processing-associated H-X9-DG protein